MANISMSHALHNHLGNFTSVHTARRNGAQLSAVVQSSKFKVLICTALREHCACALTRRKNDDIFFGLRTLKGQLLGRGQVNSTCMHILHPLSLVLYEVVSHYYIFNRQQLPLKYSRMIRHLTAMNHEVPLPNFL